MVTVGSTDIKRKRRMMRKKKEKEKERGQEWREWWRWKYGQKAPLQQQGCPAAAAGRNVRLRSLSLVSSALIDRVAGQKKQGGSFFSCPGRS